MRTSPTFGVANDSGPMAPICARTLSAFAPHVREGVPVERTHVTGNSGIDAVLYVRDGLEDGTLTSGVDWSFLNPSKRLIVVTAHRREATPYPLARRAMRGEPEWPMLVER